MQFIAKHTLVNRVAGMVALLSVCSIMPAVYADTEKAAGYATAAAVNTDEVDSSESSELTAQEASDEASAPLFSLAHTPNSASTHKSKYTSSEKAATSSSFPGRGSTVRSSVHEKHSVFS